MDGTVILTEGSTDIGGSRASIAMQAAEVLGIEAESVRPSVVDTDSIGHTDVTGGSEQHMRPVMLHIKLHIFLLMK